MKYRGIELIQQERTRQIEEEGYDPSHDAFVCNNNQLSKAAAYYAVGNENLYIKRKENWPDGKKVETFETFWPWESKFLKLKKHDRLKQLQIAGALIAAEIDSLLTRI